MILLDPIPHVGSHLLFLEEVLATLAARGETAPFLFRASEMDKLQRLLAYGTDRAEHPGGRMWDGESPTGTPIRHEDVVLATTEADIRRGEQDPSYSTSFKKFGLRGPPLLLVYDARLLIRLREKEYAFRYPDRKPEALLALIPVDLQPKIPGWFSQEEGLAYRQLVERALDEPRQAVRQIVEVGSWMGRSTAWIARYCAMRDAKLFAVDHYLGSSDGYDSRYCDSMAGQDVPAIFLERMRRLEAPVQLYRCTSTAAAERFQNGSIDLAFLDASHDEGAVREDLAAWWPRIHKNGFLAGHDFNADHPGVQAAVVEFSREQNLHLVEGPGSLWWVTR